MQIETLHHVSLQVADLDRAGRFYEEVLGFVVREETPGGISYQAADGTYFVITRSSGTPSGTHTQMGFAVRDIAAEVTALQARGIVFETYEAPETVNGIADVGIGRAAWLRDPDGNLIGLLQLNGSSRA